MDSRKLIHINLPIDMKAKLREKANDRGLTLNSLLIIIFEDFLKKNK